jgi:hypothetical protein
VDSVQIDNGYSFFYLNRIVKDVPGNPEIALRNQPQFLSKLIVTEGYGIYICSSPFNYLFFTLAGLGQTWGFTSSIEAEITSITEEDVFGQIDSVKTISLSDGNEIWLSKNFGILKFPDFENGGYFELIGVQGTEFGESVPGFWEIFDFEVGDVFQQNQQTGYIGDWWNITRKTTITSKTVTDSSYNYTVNGIYYSYGNYGPPEAYAYTDNLLFIYADSLPTNKFPGQIYQFPYSTMVNSDTVFSVAKVILDNETNLYHKHFGNKEDTFIPYENNLFYERNEESDTLFRFEEVSMIGDPCGLMGIGFGEGIGELYRTEGCFEYWSFESLTGYIKDGDTIGTITPDSILLVVGIGDLSINNKTYKIYPNPADDWLYVKPQDLGKGIYSIKLRDVYGQLARDETGLRSSLYAIDISGLQSGVYLYEIEDSSGNIQKGKLIVK